VKIEAEAEVSFARHVHLDLCLTYQNEMSGSQQSTVDSAMYTCTPYTYGMQTTDYGLQNSEI
jgi:hypothetical protein